MDRWKKQFIRYLFPYSASRMRIEHAHLLKHPHVPRHLYKYRQFSVSHLDALERGVLYMSSPDRFNDPFDTTVFFHPDRFIMEDVSLSDSLKHVDEIKRAQAEGKPWRPKDIVHPIRTKEWLLRATAELLKNEDVGVASAVMQAIEHLLETQADQIREYMRERLRAGFSVLSLSAIPDVNAHVVALLRLPQGLLHRVRL